jgi:hypothetical protein
MEAWGIDSLDQGVILSAIQVFEYMKANSPGFAILDSNPSNMTCRGSNVCYHILPLDIGVISQSRMQGCGDIVY